MTEKIPVTHISTFDTYQRLRIENRLKELKKEVKLEKEHKGH